MIIDLSGRTALVSGSSAGIGLAVAVGLARAGAGVIVNGRGARRVRAAVEAVRAAVPGAGVRGVVADLATAAGADTLIESGGDVDILVNNLGVDGPSSFTETPDAEWERYFQVNVMSGVRLSRELMPAMIERGWGRVVFVSSESALQIPLEMIHYGVTKMAQIAVARGLAEYAAGSGVTVNAVLPGADAHRGRARVPRRAERGPRGAGRARAALLRAPPPDVAPSAPGDAGGGREPDRLRVLAPSVGDDRCRAASRWEASVRAIP